TVGWWRGLGLAGLIVVVTCAYGPALGNFFTSDDLDMLAGDAGDLFSPASGFGRFMPLAAAVHRAVAVSSGRDPWPAPARLAARWLAVAVPALALAVAAYEWCEGRRPPWRRPPTWLLVAGGVLVIHLALLAWAYRIRAALYPDSGYRFLGLGGDLLGAPL